MAILAASQKWTMPLRDWHMAMSCFIIEFGDCQGGQSGPGWRKSAAATVLPKKISPRKGDYAG